MSVVCRVTQGPIRYPTGHSFILAVSFPKIGGVGVHNQSLRLVCCQQTHPRCTVHHNMAHR